VSALRKVGADVGWGHVDAEEVERRFTAIAAQNAELVDAVQTHTRRWRLLDSDLVRRREAERRARAEAARSQQLAFVGGVEKFIGAAELVLLYVFVWHAPPGETGNWLTSVRYADVAIALLTTAILATTMWFIGSSLTGLVNGEIGGALAMLVAAFLMHFSFTVYTESFVGVEPLLIELVKMLLAFGAIALTFRGMYLFATGVTKRPTVASVVISGYLIALFETAWDGGTWDPFDLTAVSPGDYVEASLQSWAWIPALLAFVGVAVTNIYKRLARGREDAHA
jgi:hypothetical protein